MEINNKELTYYISTKTKIITLSLSVIFLICGILMLIFKPDAPFYLDPFMERDFPYWGGLLILAFISFIIFLSQLGEQRTERYYLTEDGSFDMSTPRSYEKRERPKLIEFFSRNGINNFYYDGQGKVYMENGKGKEIEAPLSELKIKYWMRKNEATGDFYIHKMRVTDSQGNNLSFTTNESLMPSEFDDIHMILSNAAEVEESKLSKADKWAYKLKGVVEDFDIKNISDSVAEIIVSHGVPSASNSIINFVKTRLYRQTEKKTGFRKFWGSLKKFFNNFLLVLIGLYLLMIIIVNVANLPVIFGGHDTKEYDYNETENYYDNADAAVEVADEIDAKNEEKIQLSLGGLYEGDSMSLNLNLLSNPKRDRNGERYNIEGEGMYFTEGGRLGFDIIGNMYENGKLVLKEIDYGAPDYDIILDGKLKRIEGVYFFEGTRYVDGENLGDFKLCTDD